MSESLLTADLCDQHGDRVRVAEPVFRLNGARQMFSGPVQTLRVFEDNTLVRAALEQPGDGSVLVVDGGASTRYALLGGLLATFAQDNNWAGVIINGYIRDVLEVDECNIGIRSLGSCQQKSEKRGLGDKEVALNFAGVEFSPGNYVYADVDGIIVSDSRLF